MEQKLWDAIERLQVLEPNFVSVTYGAGGSTRDRTHRTVKRIADQTFLNPAAHLTCVAATKEDVLEVVGDYATAGIHHIVALRGDPPDGMGQAFSPHPGGYESSVDLISGISTAFPDRFQISVGCYPEPHPESRG
ncbi:MAG: methylenetetrahydrofolate reductase, partial [Pseudomonadota bacterium]